MQNSGRSRATLLLSSCLSHRNVLHLSNLPRFRVSDFTIEDAILVPRIPYGWHKIFFDRIHFRAASQCANDWLASNWTIFIRKPIRHIEPSLWRSVDCRSSAVFRKNPRYGQYSLLRNDERVGRQLAYYAWSIESPYSHRTSPCYLYKRTHLLAWTAAPSIVVRGHLNTLVYARFKRSLIVYHAPAYLHGGCAVCWFGFSAVFFRAPYVSRFRSFLLSCYESAKTHQCWFEQPIRRVPLLSDHLSSNIVDVDLIDDWDASIEFCGLRRNVQVVGV